MERSRQLGGFDHDLRIEVQKQHALLRKRALDPEPDTAIEP